MRKPRVPGYCLHKPTGQAYVTLPVKPKPKIVYLGKHGTEESKVRYQATIGEWLGGGSLCVPERPHDAPRGATLDDLVKSYLDHAEVYYRKRGEVTSHIANVRAALDPLRIDDPAETFTVKRLKAYRAEMVAAGLSRGGCNRRTQLVVRAFKWAAEEGLVPEPIWRALAVVEPLARDRTAARETRPVQPADVEIVLACIPFMPPPVAAMVRLQLATGMRPGEACSMRMADVDRSEAVWIYHPESHKTEHQDRTRVVPLGPQAQEIIREFVRDSDAAHLFSPRAWMADTRPKATRIYADRYDKDTYRRAIDRACDKAFPPPDDMEARAAWRKAHRWHPNRLRHTYATRIRREYGLEAAQILLGHARADVTQIYAERDLKAAVEIAAKVG